MDLRKTIEALKEERQRIERVLVELERLYAADAGAPAGIPRKRRGRKSMGTEERQDVSKRMRQYWAKRRQNRGQADATKKTPQGPGDPQK